MAGYGDNAGLDAYLLAAGYSYPDGVTDLQKSAARQRGSLAVDRYEPRFSGQRSGGIDQERAWPRAGAETRDGTAIPPDAIPAAIVSASYEAAFLEITSPGSLLPVVTGSETVKREKVGQIEVEYGASGSSAEDAVALATPVVTSIEAMLYPFFTPIIPYALVV